MHQLLRFFLTIILSFFLFFPSFTAAANFAGGSGTALDPWQITTPTELSNISLYNGTSSSGKYFKLMNDIDLNVSPYNTGSGWTPIGTLASRFYGTFDGNNHIISNLYINTTTDYIGLFGFPNSATFKDLGLTNVNVRGGNQTGALFGYGSATTTNVYSTGIVTSSAAYIGGLIGRFSGGVVSSSYSSASVTLNGTGLNAGGLIGYAESGAIYSSYATGNVTGYQRVGGLAGSISNSITVVTTSYATGNVIANGGAGGFVGHLYQAPVGASYATGNVTTTGGSYAGGFYAFSQTSARIYQCYATGNVYGGSSSGVGGFGGYAENVTIQDSYSRGRATGGSWVGGFVGFVWASTLTRDYSTGVVTGSSSKGGLVGQYSSGITTSSVYWDKDASGISTSAAGTGLTTAQMKNQANYSGWDFTSIWNIDGTGVSNDGYPYLRSQSFSSPAAPGVTLSTSTVSATEGGASSTFTIVLTAQPANTVTITLTTSSSRVALSTTSISFTTSSWNSPQTVTVNAMDDATAQGTTTSSISFNAASADSNYNGISISSITTTIVDNDSIGVTISTSTVYVTEGATSSYTIVLTSQPTNSVTLTLTTSSTRVALSTTTMTFTTSNWNTPQSIVVTSVDNSLVDGTEVSAVSYAVSSADTSYHALLITSTTVRVTDNDTAMVAISTSTLSVSESGATSTFTVVLTSLPSSTVMVTMATSSSRLILSTSTLTFTTGTWNVPQAVTASTADDTIVQGTTTSSITFLASSTDVNYSALSIPSIAATIMDNDSAGIVVSTSTFSIVESSTTGTLSLVLTSQPTAIVTITLTTSSSRVTLSTTTLIFTTSTWNTPRVIVVGADNNYSNDGTTTSTISFAAASSDTSYNALSLSPVIVTVSDPPDLELSAVLATPATTSSVITWVSNNAASSRVMYSPDTSYASSTPESDTSPRVTSHTVVLANVLACTTYYVRVVSTDAASNSATSTPFYFTTLGCAGNAVPSSVTSTAVSVSSTTSVTLTTGSAELTVTPPAHFTSTSSQVTIQIKSLDSSSVLTSIGKPSNSLTTVGQTVFDVKALLDAQTTLDSFDLPLTITMSYASSEVGNLDTNSLWIYRYHAGVWYPLDGCSVNTSLRTVTCTTTRFSVFALFGRETTVAPASIVHVGIGWTSYPVSRGESDTSITWVVNNGASTTTNPEINFSIQGNRSLIHSYVLSLLPDFKGASIIPYTTSTGKFILPNATGIHTLYLRYFSPTGVVLGTLTRTITYIRKAVVEGSSIPPSPVRISAFQSSSFKRTLKPGDKGEDVRGLQVFLNVQGYLVAKKGAGSPGKETTFFGPATAQALKKFQEAHAEVVLYPLGLKKGSGIFGLATLQEVNRLLQKSDLALEIKESKSL